MNRYLAILLALVLAACSMNQSASIRKVGEMADPNTPITITFEGDTALTFGMIGDITVYVRPERNADSLSVSILPGPRIELIHGAQQQDFGAVMAGQEVSMKVRYMAPEEGLYQINVHATGSFSGVRMSTSTEVPVMIYAPIAPFRDAG